MRAPRGLRAPAVPAGSARILLAVAALATLTVVGIGAVVAGTSSASPLDDALLAAAGGWSPQIWPKALPIDFLGEPTGVLMVASTLIVACLALRRWRLAVLTVAAQGLIWGAVELVKRLVDRTIHGEHLAYPSGHTAGTAAFALVVGLLLASVLQLGRSALLVVLGVTLAGGAVAAWAQTVLGAHYATDTVGGLCLTLALVPPLALAIDLLGGRFLHCGQVADAGRDTPDRATADRP